MSKHSLPQHPPLYSRADIAIGARLNLTSTRGTEHAKLMWFAVLERQDWGDLDVSSWATNTTLMHNVGLEFRSSAERAVQLLRAAAMLATPTGTRPVAQRKRGRLLAPCLGSPCKVKIPARHDMANLWALCRERRQKPAPMVTMMTGAYVLATDAAGHRPHDWTPLGCTQSDWRRFVGARKNASWTARVRECESLDLIRRNGRTVEVAPTRSWLRAWRAMESMADEDSRGPPLGQYGPHSPALQTDVPSHSSEMLQSHPYTPTTKPQSTQVSASVHP